LVWRPSSSGWRRGSRLAPSLPRNRRVWSSPGSWATNCIATKQNGAHGAPFTTAFLDSALRDAQHLGGHEDEQLALFLAATTLLEQVAQDRKVAEERHLGQVAAIAEFVDAADRHRLSILDQHCRGDMALADFRHLAQTLTD